MPTADGTSKDTNGTPHRRLSRRSAGLVVLAVGIGIGLALGLWLVRHDPAPHPRAPEYAQPMGAYAGSESCRECHERFYQLWEPSHHGKAMQPMTLELARTALVPPTGPITAGKSRYTVDLAALRVVEESHPDRVSYPMVHAMGGKNVFFFLTPLERGRLQVLPVAFDVRERQWFDTTGSMVRHFRERTDAPLDWKDSSLTFNTSCYNCHVSQLSKNYDPATDTYKTTWREPGINCEACHGPSQEHVKVCREAPEGMVPKDLRTVRWGGFSRKQKNDACAPCHAKASPISPSFAPGNRFFDHYDLVCLEDSDFHPDGRDLGENYTMTGWMMNPCAQSGLLDCTHCHTSSGRFRQQEKPNTSCLPCHSRRVSRIAQHSHHGPGAKGGPTCVSCHMPMTRFARMNRSDHSFRPPCPAAGVKFGSENACTICHRERDAKWAAATVQRWHPEGHWRRKILLEGGLVEAARNRKWQSLPDMLDYVGKAESDPVVVTSLVRLLDACPESPKWDSLRRCLTHASPLVRGAAATTLAADLGNKATADALLGALGDDYRLVRVRAASALAALPRGTLDPRRRDMLREAGQELLASFHSQPDNWSGHYSLGNYLSARGDRKGALKAFDRAIELRQDAVMAYVNASVTAAQLGQLPRSVEYLRQATRFEPEHPAVNLNLGLGLAETGDLPGAAKHLRRALKGPGTRSQAAYNLAVLTAAQDPDEAIRLCRLAVENAPGNATYTYTLAFYLAGRSPDEAIAILEPLIAGQPTRIDARLLLGRCYRATGQEERARALYATLRDDPSVPPNVRQLADRQLQEIEAKGAQPNP